MPTEQKPEEGTHAEKLALAYAMVFGRDNEHRTEAQRMVWADMEHRGYLYRSTAVPLVTGEVLPVKMEVAEGMRIFLLDTIKHISRAVSLGVKKKKPNTKRT